jgi:hypothetical protein
MTQPKKIAVVGGGATGLSLLWCLTSQDATRDQVELTLFHNDPTLGGHSRTLYPEFGGKKYPVDLGVQYICPLLYPNTYKMLGLEEFSGVTLQEHGEIKLAATFNEKLNWGNFPAYQTGPLFENLYTPENQLAALEFEAYVMASFAGNFSKTIGDYIKEKQPRQEFVDYFLMPYLSILNGYGEASQLRDGTFEDLWPVFTPLSDPGPLASFIKPGLGWQRFADGSSSWIQAMADYATTRGATVRTSAKVSQVWPDDSGDGVWVAWGNPIRGQTNPPEKFDAVVLTTDMTTNRALLDNPRNPYYSSPNQPVTQEKYISEEAFPLNPGSCYIHQDSSVLAPYLTTRDEVIQFTAYYSPEPKDGLPYDMATTYSTWLVQNMVPDLPEPIYVSMYGSYEAPNPPKNQLFEPIPWRHGRFLGSYMYTSKRNLHNIQGLGDVWFAGNNTTQDSEEGALTSAMVIAEKICPDWRYPFFGVEKHSIEATFMYELMKDEVMFPVTESGLWRHFKHWVEQKLHLPEDSAQ